MDKKLTTKEQEQIKKRVKHSFECEKMNLTASDENGLDKLLKGEKTADQLVKEELEKMKEEGLIK